jgi:hypothetical protein
MLPRPVLAEPAIDEPHNAAAALTLGPEVVDDMVEDLQHLLSYMFFSFSLFIGLSSSFHSNFTLRSERSQDDNRASDEANSIKRFILLQTEMRRDVIQDIAERAAIEARLEMAAAAGQGVVAA